MCARFLSHLLLLYIGRVQGAISGCTVLWNVLPASAQNKSLISDTARLFYTSSVLPVASILVLSCQGVASAAKLNNRHLSLWYIIGHCLRPKAGFLCVVD